MVNVGKSTIHGLFGYDIKIFLRSLFHSIFVAQERRMWPELFKDAFGILLPFSLHYRASLDDAVAFLDF